MTKHSFESTALGALASVAHHKYTPNKMLKQPLYRKVNTRARGVHHNFGGEYRHDRNTKDAQQSEGTRTSMHGKAQRGLDYTPLFRFLLSKIGKNWNQVYAEAVERLDRPEPIFWLVAMDANQRNETVRVGESTYYSGLYVDDEGLLQMVNPTLGPSSLAPYCKCCTHTFNGKPFTQRFSADESFYRRDV
jgi:hypothetical protein